LLQQIGERLKAMREEKGLSLAEISETTKIRVRYLQALEEGNLDILPGAVYTIGFVRAYMRSVGCQDEEIVNAYKAYYNILKTDKIRADKEASPEDMGEASLAITEIKKRRISEVLATPHPQKALPTRQRTFLRRRLWLGVLIAICCIFGFLYVLGVQSGQELEPNINGQQQTDGQQPDTTLPVVPGNVTPDPEPDIVEPGITEPGDTEVSGTEPEGVLVKLTIAEGGQCWVGVTSDGEYSQDTLVSGEVYEFRAEKELKIRYGNLGVVKEEYNGKVTDPLGDVGETGTFVYQPEETASPGQTAPETADTLTP